MFGVAGQGVCHDPVSNTADRSRSIRREGEPASAAICRVFVTLTRAVSVLWAERKLDWKQVIFFRDVVPPAEQKRCPSVPQV